MQHCSVGDTIRTYAACVRLRQRSLLLLTACLLINPYAMVSSSIHCMYVHAIGPLAGAPRATRVRWSSSVMTESIHLGDDDHVSVWRRTGQRSDPAFINRAAKSSRHFT
ncbi:hypothetical protein TNCV_4151101 [Trichonephila clavipes]|nr:hypothetical protein TNCV_4151101 [Trichonephila clavipes]